MKKIINVLSLLIVCILLLIVTGCGLKNSSLDESTLENIYGEHTFSWDAEDGAETEAVESVDDRTVDLTDYSSYLKKIWIVEGWNDSVVYPVSLVITQMEEGYIKGYFCFNDIITFYYRNLTLWKYRTPEFTGTIYDGTAECDYDYKNGDMGRFSITFCENDRIEVRLNGNEEQSYLLRPYNVSDEKFLGEPTTIEVELDSWGTVTLFYANLDFEKTYPWVLLLNEQGDILYTLSAAWVNPQEVKEIIIADMNEDGLKDVKVVTHFPDDPNDWDEWYFYQLEDGTFYMGLHNYIEDNY